MNVEKRGKEFGISKSTANFKKVNSSAEQSNFMGSISTFDGFFEKKPMTFNVTAEQQYCKEINRTVIIFRFSPKPLKHKVWDTLNEVRLPIEICKE